MTAQMLDVTTADWSSAMADFATSAGERLEGATPFEILEWAAETFGDGLVVATSLQDSVTVDLASRVRPGIDVVFLDTGYHFAETDRHAGRRQLGLPGHVPEHRAQADRGPAGRAVRQGPVADQPRPVLRDAQGRAARAGARPATAPGSPACAGSRRSPAATPMAVEWDAKRQMVKINPIVAWDDEELDKYIAHRGILINPLQYDGYPSIGCAPVHPAGRPR